MSTTLHSFMDIFETTIEDGDTSVQLNKIVIPLIQRDYAQGRIDKDINRVRSRFLQALYRAVTGEPITLDFVYGDIDEEGTMSDLSTLTAVGNKVDTKIQNCVWDVRRFILLTNLVID